MSRPRLIALLLVLLTILVYLPVINHGFSAFDDDDCVTANSFVSGGLTWENVHWAFTSGRTGNWMPLTWLSHMAVCQGFGLRAGVHHFVNVLFHAANGVLVFALLRRWTGALWPSLAAAALFAWHPLHVESVAWITERKDMLSTFFGLAALWSYTRYAESSAGQQTGQPGLGGLVWTWDYGLALMFFAGSLMSKPMLVTLPCLLLLLDCWPLGRMQFAPSKALTPVKTPSAVSSQPLALIWEKWPFFLLTLVFCVVTFLAQRAEGLVNSLDAIPLVDRLGNVPLAYVRYLCQTLWPVDLVVFYPFPMAISPVAIAGTLLLLGLISTVVWRERWRAPWWLFGWLWFLGTLLPVIGVVSFGGQAMANRFMYFPSIGLFLALALSFQALARRSKPSAWVIVSAGCAGLVVCLAMTANQLRYWRNDVALFSHVLEATKENRWFKLRDLGILHYHLGTALAQAGRPEEAVAEYRAAVAVRPYYVQANDALGTALMAVGQWAEAIGCFERVNLAEPGHAEIHCKLGIALAAVGRREDALRQYEQALKLKPDFAEAHFNLGIALAGQGQALTAIGEFEQALKWKPDYAEAHNNLGIAFARQGRVPEAMDQFQMAIRAKPADAEAYNNLGIALAGQGKWAEAVQRYEQALKIRPDYAKARISLGLALVAQGKSGEGLEQMQQALALAAAQGNAPLADSIRARIRSLQPNDSPPPAR